MRTLKQLTLILITGLTACSKKDNQSDISLSDSVEKVEIAKSADNQNNGDTTITEKYFPAENTASIKDTLVQSLGIQIIITERTLDSYVTNEHTEEKTKYIDKYRDIERTVKITRNKEVLVDTVFNKEMFKGILNQDFMNIANFYGYWINNVTADKIEFFGTIGKPETDWTFAFYHYFDVKTKTFEIKELVDEEI